MARRRLWVFITIGAIVALVAFRVSLPWFVTRYANKVLHDIPEYGGSVADVDLSLLRGAYTIHKLVVFKKASGNTEIPFIDIPRLDFSVQWSALLHGAIVGEAVIDQPSFNFINKTQAGEKVNWVGKAKELLPVRINRFEIVDGTVAFYDFTAEPDVNIRLEELNLVATNFANVEESGGDAGKDGAEDNAEELPATIKATGVAIGDGRLTMDMRLNPLLAIPDLDMNLKFENVNMPALNDFFRAYAKVDVEQGTLSVYSEMAVNDGIVQGYIKPVAEHVEIVDLQKDNENPVSLIWQTIVDAATEIFKSDNKDRLATQIPLNGDVNNAETSVWVALWNIYRNGFVQVFSKSTNNSIEFEDVSAGEEQISR